jgi:hypothetical protein
MTNVPLIPVIQRLDVYTLKFLVMIIMLALMTIVKLKVDAVILVFLAMMVMLALLILAAPLEDVFLLLLTAMITTLVLLKPVTKNKVVYTLL